MLDRRRRALLDRLVMALSSRQLSETLVVFDAKHAPAGADRRMDHAGLRVLFAASHDEADDLIEELIRAHHSSRKLTVVSSDHRIQAAAKKRRAHFVDSEVWIDHLESNSLPGNRRAASANTHVSSANDDKRQDLPQADQLTQDWQAFFSELPTTAEESKPVSTPVNPKASEFPPSDSSAAGEKDDVSLDIDNPFPPGYGEEILKRDD